MTLTSPTTPTRRDRWGRYQVVNLTTGKLTGYTRATTVAKALDDGSGLIGWSKRMVALGLAVRPDLVALVSATGPDDKKALDQICERAAEAGGSTVRRDLGTAIHGMLEQSWSNPDYQAPQPYTADIIAVHEALKAAGLTVDTTLVERIVVDDTYQIAGTFDLMVRDSAGHLRVADIKTGSSLMGALSFAIQLAIYANADALYTQGPAANGSEDVREPMPKLATDYGFILHVQPGTGVCDIHTINLTIGAEALELAMAVRATTKLKPLAPYKAPATPTVEEAVEMVMAAFPGAELVTHVNDQWRAWMTTRLLAIKAAGAIDALAMHWPTGVPAVPSGDPITIEQSIDIERAVSLVESNAGLAFPEPIEPLAAPKPTPISDRRPRPDEGATVPDDVVAIINGLAQSLSITDRSWVLGIITRCHNANYPIRMSGPGGKPTARRAAICTALVTLAPFGDEALVRALVGLAISEDLQPGHDLAAAFGSLTLDEAQRLQRLANAVANTFLVPIWGEDGVAITGDITAALAA